MLSAVCEFCFALIFCAIIHPLVELFQQALVLSEDLRVRKTAESVWTAKNAKLEAYLRSSLGESDHDLRKCPSGRYDDPTTIHEISSGTSFSSTPQE
jgi:hypothetical protein